MTPPKTVAEVLAAWISDRGGQLNPRANELGISWDTLRRWARGEVLPKRRDLAAISSATGYPIDALALLHTSDHAARLARCGAQVHTPEQAAAWAAAHAPATAGKDGAAV